MNGKLGYYPGCSLESTAYEFNASLKAVFDALKIELAEVPDWSCCGASPAHSTNAALAYSLLLRNLSLAEAANLSPLIVPCAACYNLLKAADVKVREGNAEIVKANEQLRAVSGASYSGTVDIVHPLGLLNRPEYRSLIAERVIKPLTGLKVVTYYGCLLTRPSYVAFDDCEYPVVMDRVVANVGAEVKKWSYKTDCCGATLSLARAERVEKFSSHFVTQARRAGADAIVVACPLCHANLDTRQTQEDTMPILYFSELIGISFGLPGARKWLDRHIIDPAPLLQGLNLL